MDNPTPQLNGEALPTRNWVSAWSMLWVQAQNAFNDNLVKFVLIGLALEVAKESFLGSNIEILTSSILPLPFILFAPLAGYFSDRYSKRSVIIACLVAQVLIFAWMGAAVAAKSLVMAFFGFALLSLQSCFFSPAKQGIVKELVGSSKVGVVAGWMQMLTMLAILGGMWAGGTWFESLNATRDSSWSAASIPVLVIGIGALLPLALAFGIQKTPAHPDKRFHPGLLIEHFQHLGDLLRVRRLKIAAFGVAWFWFGSYLMGMFTINLGDEMFPDAGDKAAAAASKMYAVIGIGLMVGSFVVSMLSRRGIPLRLPPFGCFAFALGIIATAVLPTGSAAFFGALGFMGFVGSFFLVPLNAFIIDEAPEDERGKVLSATNLLTSSAGLSAGALVMAMKTAHIPTSTQMIGVAIPTVLMAIFLWLRPPNWTP